jgi:iron complex transport system ATP-binding protein
MVELKDLTCGYNGRFLLKDINLKIEQKELMGIIGPNGSGKTTLIRAITRILRPKKGNIFFEGRDIWKVDVSELAKKIAVVSQNHPTNFMTVQEFVLLGRIPHFKRLQFLETKEDLEIAKNAMILTDTLRFKDRSLEEISGGERQLVFIARALAQQPRLLILDEPTTHLDITHQVTVLNLIKKLNTELNLTVIMVLHDLNLASEYCQRLTLLHEGKIYKTGPPDEVLDYRIIEEVYNTVVVVQKNPISFKPYIFLVSQEERLKI